MDYLKVVILAVVEGITEFLPISSTGHLILVMEFLDFTQEGTFVESFLVVIQLPAILAVVVYFWGKLWPFQQGPEHFQITFTLWTKIAVAFIPAAILGVLLNEFIEERLFSPTVVAVALITGGIVLIVIETIGYRIRMQTVHDIGYLTAFAIGCFQCLAMIPGTSRSASSIIGGMVLGASRPAAAEFSFFLAIPTMLGATVFSLYKHGLSFTGHQWTLLGLGSLISFVTAYFAVAFLMNFLKRHSFRAFGYYRIAVGIVVLVALRNAAG